MPMNRSVARSLPIVLFLFSAGPELARAQEKPPAAYDIVITNGRIIDGSGSPWYSGDIGIRDGRIAAIGNLAAAQRARAIDAHGLVVAPGFTDMLRPSELTILTD